MVKIFEKDELEDLKKSDFQPLSEEDVEEVSGGYKSKKGFTKGMEIICPVCGNKNKKSIQQRPNPYTKWDVFICDECETCWGLDEYGEVDWS